MEKFEILKQAYKLTGQYTSFDSNWRPGIIDLLVYDILMGMHESDYEDSTPMWLWRKTPDEIMEHIISKDRIFDVQYGLDNLDEEIRDYLILEEFIVDPDDVDDEEYQANLEGHGITPNPANLTGE